MKKLLLSAVAIVALVLIFKTPNTTAAEQAASASTEYVTVRWAGRENMHLIRPGGEVEFIWSKLKSIKRPDRCDERAFYINLAMNSLAKDGYQVVTLFNDDLIMKREPHRAQ
jgi:hypothetical protein